MINITYGLMYLLVVVFVVHMIQIWLDWGFKDATPQKKTSKDSKKTYQYSAQVPRHKTKGAQEQKTEDLEDGLPASAPVGRWHTIGSPVEHVHTR
jgi:hypothetical protein